MLRLRINWTGLNQGYSIWHFTGSDDQTGADDAAAAAAVWLAAVDNFLSVAQGFQVDPEVLVVNPATGQTTGSFGVSSSPGTGADSNNPLPNAAMGLVRWRTGVYNDGRELRGRTFIPGITENSCDANGNLSDTARSAIAAASNDLNDTTDFCVYSPTHHMQATPTNISVWQEFAYLRSRR